MWMSSKSDCPMSAPSPTFFLMPRELDAILKVLPENPNQAPGTLQLHGTFQPTYYWHTLWQYFAFRSVNDFGLQTIQFNQVKIGLLPHCSWRPCHWKIWTAWMLWSQHLQKWPLAHCHVRFWMRPPTRRGFVSYAKYTHGLRGFLLASIPLSSPVYIWPTFPRWRNLQLASHLPCTMTCAQRRGTTWKGGGKQREAKQPNALRRSSVPPSAPRVWRMLPHPRPDQRQQMIAPFQAANASWRPFAKWEPNQALFLEPASHSFSARLFVITPFWWCRIPTSDSLRFTCFISYMTCAYICHKLGYSTLE